MPQMADITVKKADGTTNVTYVALTPSAGDKVPANWRNDAAHVVSGFRPSLSLKSEPGNQSRRLMSSYWFPVVKTINGVDAIVARIPIVTTYTVPTNVADADVAEAVEQHANLTNSSLIKTSVKAGFAPT